MACDAGASPRPALPAENPGKPVYGSLLRTFGKKSEMSWCPAVAGGSGGAVALDGGPVHDPALAGVVVERIVLGAAVVPQRQRTRPPAEPSISIPAMKPVALSLSGTARETPLTAITAPVPTNRPQPFTITPISPPKTFYKTAAGANTPFVLL